LFAVDALAGAGAHQERREVSNALRRVALTFQQLALALQGLEMALSRLALTLGSLTGAGCANGPVPRSAPSLH
jgi:hypothetical protein